MNAPLFFLMIIALLFACAFAGGMIGIGMPEYTQVDSDELRGVQPKGWFFTAEQDAYFAGQVNQPNAEANRLNAQAEHEEAQAALLYAQAQAEQANAYAQEAEADIKSGAVFGGGFLTAIVMVAIIVAILFVVSTKLSGGNL